MNQVEKHYPFFSLNGIDLELAHGQIMGFIGANGAGKSTTIRILMAMVRQDAGVVKVLGHSIPARQVAAKWDIGYATEDMRLYKNATLGWHMQYIASIFPGWDHAYAKLLIKRFDLIPEQKKKDLDVLVGKYL